MIPGFNHNVKYRGRVFHCQTEDSGVANPHIITHLFVGGNILATKKTSYADIVKSDKLEEVVQDLMQEQHKEILKKLLSGSYDEAIEQRGANAAHLNGPAPLNVDAGAQNRVSMLAGMSQAHASSTAAPRAQAQPATTPAPQPAKAPAASPAVPAQQAKAATPPAQKPPATPQIALPSTAKPAAAATAAAQAKPQAPAVPQKSVTPAPAAAPAAGKSAPPTITPGKVQPAPAPLVARALPQEVLDAQQLTVLPQVKNTNAETIFGEDLVSEKSLDEVILSYLAQEVER